jgi:hypothetical protein
MNIGSKTKQQLLPETKAHGTKPDVAQQCLSEADEHQVASDELLKEQLNFETLLTHIHQIPGIQIA